MASALRVFFCGCRAHGWFTLNGVKSPEFLTQVEAEQIIDGYFGQGAISEDQHRAAGQTIGRYLREIGLVVPVDDMCTSLQKAIMAQTAGRKLATAGR